MKEILLVEDDKTLSYGLCMALSSEQIHVDTCFNLKFAKEALKKKAYDLVILDVNLPDGSGIDLLKEIRAQSLMSVILLTANDTEMDVVTGLELGADDYIVKPFSLAILRARVQNQLRKICSQSNHQKAIYQFGELEFDFIHMIFLKNGQPIELSKTEQKLLRYLVENKGITLTRAQMIDYIWSNELYVDENALSVTVKRLRDKIEDGTSKTQYIKTIYGIGYTWLAE